MKELDQMTPMEIVHAMFSEFNKLNQRLDKIEKALIIQETTFENKIFTLTEAAEYLNICKTTLYRYNSINKIPFYKTGKRVYFRKDDLDEYLTKDYHASNDDIERMASDYCLKNPLKL